MDYIGPVPSVQLKPLILDEVAKKSALEKSSLWSSVESTISDVSFDPEMVTRLFSKARVTGTKEMKLKKAASKTTVKKDLGLVDPKRMHNLNISLSKLKIPHDKLCKAIVSIDVDILDTANIDVMKLCLPMPQEITAVKKQVANSDGEIENESSKDSDHAG